MATMPSYVTVALAGFEEQRGKNGVVRSQMESGPAKQRKVQTKLLVTRPVTLYIKTLANYQSWIGWVKTTLSSGTDWFTWTDPIDSVAKQARIVNGEYTAKPNGSTANWQISLSLETWE